MFKVAKFTNLLEAPHVNLPKHTLQKAIIVRFFIKET